MNAVEFALEVEKAILHLGPYIAHANYSTLPPEGANEVLISVVRDPHHGTEFYPLADGGRMVRIPRPIDFSGGWGDLKTDVVSSSHLIDYIEFHLEPVWYCGPIYFEAPWTTLQVATAATALDAKWKATRARYYLDKWVESGVMKLDWPIGEIYEVSMHELRTMATVYQTSGRTRDILMKAHEQLSGYERDSRLDTREIDPTLAISLIKELDNMDKILEELGIGPEENKTDG